MFLSGVIHFLQRDAMLATVAWYMPS